MLVANLRLALTKLINFTFRKQKKFCVDHFFLQGRVFLSLQEYYAYFEKARTLSIIVFSYVLKSEIILVSSYHKYILHNSLNSFAFHPRGD